MKSGFTDRIKRIFSGRIWDVVIFCILILYPLRHSAEGLDLWDAGYNCANFVSPGPDRMSSVWYFSTILATRIGHIFTLLPYGRTYIGLNIYAGLIISAGVCLSYLFMVRKAGMNKWAAALGMLIMMSMCYSPVTIVYTHLSGVLLTLAIICIYMGLTEEKGYCLIFAGFILGLNVFVRFSNLVQAALIIAVWVYVFISEKKGKEGEVFKKCLHLTLKCMAGYLLAVITVLLIIHTVYGADEYFRGVMGLFNMDSGADYYTFSYMLKDMLISYLRGMYRFLFIAVAFAVLYALSGIVRSVKTRLLTGAVTVTAILVFICIRGLLQFDFYHYAVAYNTAALYLDIVMMFALFTFFSSPKKEERLLAMLILLQIMLTSVGSNTGISVTMNSMYLTGPYLILKVTGIKDMIPEENRERLMMPVYAARLILACFILQAVLFGISYVYQEGNNTGARDSFVTGNEVLKGVRMSSERAGMLQDMTDYMNANGLTGHDSVIYGFVPAIAYYLDMPSVISCWPDLASYNPQDMNKDLKRVISEAKEGRREYPVLIIGDLLKTSGIDENPEKTGLIYDLAHDNGYIMTHSNETFEVWEKNGGLTGR